MRSFLRPRKFLRFFSSNMKLSTSSSPFGSDEKWRPEDVTRMPDVSSGQVKCPLRYGNFSLFSTTSQVNKWKHKVHMKVFIRWNALSFFGGFCNFIIVLKRCQKETQINSIDSWMHWMEPVNLILSIQSLLVK